MRSALLFFATKIKSTPSGVGFFIHLARLFCKLRCQLQQTSFQRTTVKTTYSHNGFCNAFCHENDACTNRRRRYLFFLQAYFANCVAKSNKQVFSAQRLQKQSIHATDFAMRSALLFCYKNDACTHRCRRFFLLFWRFVCRIDSRISDISC